VVEHLREASYRAFVGRLGAPALPEYPLTVSGAALIRAAQLSGRPGSRSNDRGAEADLVGIGIPIDRLARFAGIRDQLIRLDAT